MNAEQTSDDQALERLLDDLAKSAVAKICCRRDTGVRATNRSKG
jgi:hypothetical protein